MAIYTATLSAIVAAANAKNPSLGITLAEATYSKPRLNDETWEGEQLPGNTLMRITPNETSKYSGTTLVGYDRVSVATLGGILGNQIALPETIALASAAIPYFDSLYSIQMHPEDFEEANITDKGDGTRQLILTAKADAVAWIGGTSATFTVKAAPVPIGNVITTTVLDGYKYISDSVKGFAETYSYPIDFTPQFATLSTITDQTAEFTGLAAALTAATGEAWKATGADKFTLEGAVITHAGINEEEWPTNHSYKYAILVQLGAACANLEGTLVIHFNDPVETFNPGTVD